jgi:hypothetical protein
LFGIICFLDFFEIIRSLRNFEKIARILGMLRNILGVFKFLEKISKISGNSRVFRNF